MMGDLKLNDSVYWYTPQGKTNGKVVKVATRDMQYHGLVIHASPDDPRYVVRSQHSGKYAAHRGDALSHN